VSATSVAILITVAIIGAGAGAGAEPSAPAPPSRASEWETAALDSKPPAPAVLSPLPFNPFTFEAPVQSWERLPDRRWWAAVLVEAVVAAGLLGSDRAAPAASFTESLMRRPELGFDLPLAGPDPDDHLRLRLQLNMKRGRPSAAVVLVW
jgi:hypothetical protein